MTMLALACEAFAMPPLLTERGREIPAPAPGEVRVQVAYAGLGYVDALICAGQYQVRPALPFIPGSEVSGWVDATGAGVCGLRRGDRVAGLVAGGALAAFAVAREALVVKIPDALPLRTAAAVVTNYCTAAYGLHEIGRARADETMLVLGAGGGLGLAALDIARRAGLRTVALAATDAKRRAAAEQGADVVIDYSIADWRQEVEQRIGKATVDIVFDPVGGGASETAFRLLRPGGRHLVLGFASGEIARLPMNLPLLRRSILAGVDWGGALRADHGLFALVFAPLAEALATGALAAAQIETVPLGSAAGALARIRDRATMGKLVVEIMAEAG